MNLFQKLFAPGVTSEQWSLNKWDFIKGFILSVFAPAITMIIDSITSWTSSANAPFVLDWKMLLKVSVSCFVGYLIKNFVTTPQNPPLK